MSALGTVVRFRWRGKEHAGVVTREPVAFTAVDWLESRAAAYDADAEHLDKPDAAPVSMPKPPFTPLQRRAIAAELRDCARDITARTPRRPA